MVKKMGEYLFIYRQFRAKDVFPFKLFCPIDVAVIFSALAGKIFNID
ncbi:uncharacterized protein METZ01_LOCUS399534, partial [marine metagenome]